jgi:hypothetical protein
MIKLDNGCRFFIFQLLYSDRRLKEPPAGVVRSREQPDEGYNDDDQ